MQELQLDWRALPNGMRVVMNRQPGVHRACIMLNVGAGCEDERLWGTAHMLEHLMFRGTRRYPSFGAMSEAFEQYGADFNAFTAREVTTFEISTPAVSFPAVLDLLGDVMANPKLTGIGAERDIVREEILSDYDGDSALINVDDLLISLFYGDAGHPIAGNPQDLEKITSREVRAFYETYYVASDMLLVVTGAIGPADEVMAQIEHAFGSLPSDARRWPRRKMPAEYRAGVGGTAIPPKLHIRQYDGATQSDVSLGFLFGGSDSPDLPVLEMLVRILDDGMASRLSRRLVEELALVYDVEAYLSMSQDTTLFQIRASCRHRRVIRLVSALYEILGEIARDGVTEAELDRVRRRVIWEHEELLDGVSRLGQWLSSMAMQNMPCDIGVRCQKLLAVTSDDIRSIVQGILRNRLHMTAIVGDLGEKTVGALRETMEKNLGRGIELVVSRPED